MTITKWGIIGTGTIAAEGAKAINFLPDAELYAVGSRSQDSAERFGSEWDVPVCHGSYESLVNDPQVDVIYVATPHPYHKGNALLAINAGKPVLLEKPLTVNAKEATELIDLAREKGFFLMEAMWARFVPANVTMRDLVQSGEIGAVNIIMVNLTFDQPYDLNGRLYRPELAGGALLDLGVYVVSYASWLLGEPSGIQSHAFAASTGVDQRNSLLLNYDSGASALLTSAMRSPAPVEALIIGSKGSIRVHDPFYCPTKLTIDKPGEESKQIDIPYDGTGFHYEFSPCSGLSDKGIN